MKREIQILLLVISASFMCIQEGYTQEASSIFPQSLSIGINSDSFMGMELGYIHPLTILSFTAA